MSSSGVVQELQTSFQLLWVKLQSLPKADVTEVVFFSLMLLFIVVVLLFMFIACCHCCCSGDRKQRRVIQVRPEG